MLAALCGEPWCYTPAEAGKLTLYQVNRVLFAPRDERGALKISPKGTPATDRERFDFVYLLRGLPRWRVAELWDEYCRKAAAGKGR